MTSRAGSDEAIGPAVPVMGGSRTRLRWLGGALATALRICWRTLAKAWHDRILGMSAESAFWQLLSLPSMLIALLGLLGYTARWLGPNAVDQIRDWALSASARVLTPRVVDQVVAPVVSQILDHNRTDVIGIGSVVALWTGSSATATFVNTITIAYGQRDLRNAVRSRLVALKLYLFTVLAGVVVLPTVVFGPGMLDNLFSGGWHDAIRSMLHVLYWPLLGAVVFVGITTFYHLATPVRLRWRRAFPGAVLALALFLALSYGLQVYITAIATNLRVYATLAAPILALMYFYALAFAVLLGAEFNAALEERWPRGSRGGPGTWLLHRIRRHESDESDSGDDPDGDASDADADDERTGRPGPRPAPAAADPHGAARDGADPHGAGQNGADRDGADPHAAGTDADGPHAAGTGGVDPHGVDPDGAGVREGGGRAAEPDADAGQTSTARQRRVRDRRTRADEEEEPRAGRTRGEPHRMRPAG